VDREERPDLDGLWMQACQVFTAITEGRASGGWPLHVFLEPDSLRPFFAGTYFPPTPAFGRVSFPQLLRQLAMAWKDRREQVRTQAAELARMVQAEMACSQPPRPLDQGVLAMAAQALVGFHDRVHGGFGGAPKFPQPSLLRFLQDRSGDLAAGQVVHRTLERMALGGVRDQLDGGFHRYAVDASWTVPHFEKMLYDQGQLLTVYAAASRGDPFLARVTGELADFVVGVMREPCGAFAAALDADAAGREGAAHVWRPAEVEAALQSGECQVCVPLALQALGLERSANFRDPHHPHQAPAWVLTLAARPAELAEQAGWAEDTWWQAFDRARQVLLADRARRPQPFRDTAVIAAWNGLAIEGLAHAGMALRRPDLVEAAGSAATFVLEQVRTPSGELARSWRDGAVSGPAFLEDLGCLALGLLALQRADGDGKWLIAAGRLLHAAWEGFWIPERGWIEAAADDVGRFTHVAGVDDGAVPSGAGAATLAMAMLAEQGGDAVHADRAMQALALASGAIAERPTSAPLSLIAAACLGRVRPGQVAGAMPDGPVRAELMAVDRAHERFELLLHVASGHHIQGHLASDDVALQITPRDPDVRIQTRWPEPLEPGHGQRVLQGQVRVPITLLAPCPGPRPLRLRVRWQCCVDGPAGRCMPPEEADVEA
jgi:uncharacterized protein YyaL (SSP411 family)